MPTIITRGLGYDEPTIVYRDVATGVVGTVVLRDTVGGVVKLSNDAPIGHVTLEPIALTGFVQVERKLLGQITPVQFLVGYLTEEGPLMSSDTNRIVMYLRDDRTLAVTVNYEDGTVADLAGAKIWFTVKQKSSDPDSEAKITKRNTAAGGSDTEIKVTNPSGGAVEIYVIPADTVDLNPGIYTYDVQVQLANGKTYTIVKDRITFREDVTKAS